MVVGVCAPERRVRGRRSSIKYMNAWMSRSPKNASEYGRMISQRHTCHAIAAQCLYATITSHIDRTRHTTSHVSINASEAAYITLTSSRGTSRRVIRSDRRQPDDPISRVPDAQRAASATRNTSNPLLDTSQATHVLFTRIHINTKVQPRPPSMSHPCYEVQIYRAPCEVHKSTSRDRGGGSRHKSSGASDCPSPRRGIAPIPLHHKLTSTLPAAYPYHLPPGPELEPKDAWRPRGWAIMPLRPASRKPSEPAP